MLRDLVAKGHELVLLRDAIDWQRFEKALGPAYCSDNGRPSIPVRMMAGLTFLKYMFGLSDQDVLDNNSEIEFLHDQLDIGNWVKREKPATTERIKTCSPHALHAEEGA